MSSYDYFFYTKSRRSVKYDINEIPKDYLFSDIFLIKEVLFMYFEEIGDFKASVEDIENYYDLSLDHIVDKMTDEGIIKKEVDFEYINRTLDAYTNKKLKNILINYNLEVPESLEDKKELIKKELSEKLSPSKIKVTQKGNEFYKKIFKESTLFLDCCDEYFYFNEFHDLCLNNPEKSENENLVEFMNLHHELALKREDFIPLLQYYSSMGYYYNVIVEDFEKGLNNILKEIILSFNPVFFPKEYYSEYEPLNFSLNNNLILLSDKFSPDYVKNRFCEVWDEWTMDNTYTSKETCMTYLDEMLKSEKSYENINHSFSIR